MSTLTPSDVAEILETAHRLGEKSDHPEGRRWIQLSDTLALRMAAALRADAEKAMVP
jgi:hypothetical protein